MAEDVYAVPDLTKKVRYGRRERQQEMEERGEREERMVDIYVSADDLDPDPGTQQNAVQQNTTQVQNGDESKNNRFRAAAVCLGLLGLLCVILLAVIIGLVKHNSVLMEEKNHLQSRFDHLESRYNNVTEQNEKRRLCELPGWQIFGIGYYYISTEEKTWEQSRQYCRDNQSDLIIINSKEKQVFVNKVVNKVVNEGESVWLGLTDRDKEVEWEWVDGTTLTTPTYWRSGEPSDTGGGEDCAAVYHGNNKEWNDVPCSVTMRWMCEKVVYNV